MYAVLALLFLGAVCGAFFIALFAGGALIGIGGLGMQALRAVGRSRDVKVEATLPHAVVRPACAPEAAKVKAPVELGTAYAVA